MPRTGPNTNPNPGVTQSAAPDFSAAPAPPIPPVEYGSKAEFVRNAFVKLRPNLEEQIERLKRPDADVEERENAAIDIGKIGDAAGIPALVAALTGDPDSHVRYHAAYALGVLKDAS